MSPCIPEDHPILAALVRFAARDDLPEAARTDLALILSGSFACFGVTPEGKIALSAPATAKLLDVTPDCLTKWRAKHLGPQWVPTSRGSSPRVLYPVDCLIAWLREVAVAGSGRVDASVLAALGVEQKEAA